VKTIQIRNVPDAVDAALRTRAAAAGVSLDQHGQPPWGRGKHQVRWVEPVVEALVDAHTDVATARRRRGPTRGTAARKLRSLRLWLLEPHRLWLAGVGCFTFHSNSARAI